ncbi:MAG: rhodanese-like domain-containing protein [Chloroflexota bacterium]|nr:rhodanese-like domain-containing protein [Chloroflexota bacterium]
MTPGVSKEPPDNLLLETPDEELPSSDYLPEIPRISVESVKAKLDSEFNIVIVDSRSETNYNQSHIPGAISMPLKTMVEPYTNLDGYDEIIFY